MCTVTPSNALARFYLSAPGAFANRGSYDWVQKKISWWLEHRTSAPILIDATGRLPLSARNDSATMAKRTVTQRHGPHRKLSTSMRLLPALFTSENSSVPSGDNAMPYHHGFRRSTIVVREPVANSKKSIDVLCGASPTARK
jgi:hypothetical protein